MDSLELKMVDSLKILKEKYHVTAIKAEFGEEGTDLEEAKRLKELISKANLPLVVKIGGCEAVKDIREAKSIGVTSLVAPMIESPYAAKKYIHSVQKVFSEKDFTNLNLFINIETKYGFNYIDEILSSDYANYLTGIVLGRTDLIGSLNINKNEINNQIILEFANKMAEKTLKYKKEMYIGGGVSPESVDFFKKVSPNALIGFETRKVIFDANSALKESDICSGIIKAMEFEIMWLKNKNNLYHTIGVNNAKF